MRSVSAAPAPVDRLRRRSTQRSWSQLTQPDLRPRLRRRRGTKLRVDASTSTRDRPPGACFGFGRDLHDGIAPLLAGAGLTAEALRKGMTPGTADEQDAERLASRLRNAATEIRRLAHDLQPAPVEDRGLEAALADYIATLDAPAMPKIRLRAEVTRPLPTAVEHGAYLVVLEALNNVTRHAHAGHCDVTLTLDSGELVLLVTDDGVGLSQPYVSGIGITSMRSRVQALGGVFALGAAADGGTWVRARIPVEP